jgi:pyruvate kinase
MRKRHTRIIATLGPACCSVEMIRKLILAGADVFRLNASHAGAGTLEQYVQAIREASERCGVYTGILLDLQGPKIRLGAFQTGSATLREGELFRITTDDVAGTDEQSATTYRDFGKDVRVGEKVLLADGAVEMIVLSNDGTAANCRVVRGGVVFNHQGINLPGTALSAPSVTDKDRRDMLEGIRLKVDMIALSFVRRASDIIRLREDIARQGAQLPIIAKIERAEAWQGIDEILEAGDGAMVARGDLGVEVSLGLVPHIQKTVIDKSIQQNRFVITATQMLESMIESPVPTRAEVSDITNAIYDGTDAVMLSAETAKGKYPVEAVRIMAEIAESAELHAPERHQRVINRSLVHFNELVADLTYRAARVSQVKGIAVFTETGHTAHLIAAQRPDIPVFAFTPNKSVACQLSVWHGVTALISPPLQSVEEMVEYMDQNLVSRNWINRGETILLAAGDRVGHAGTTNMLKVHMVSGSVL